MRHPLSILALAAILPLAAVSFPFLAFAVFVPFFGFLALPSILTCAVVLLYGTTWLAYLLLLPPVGSSSTSPASTTLPWSPKRCYRVNNVLWRHLKDFYRLRVGNLIIDWCYRRVLILGNSKKRGESGNDKLVKENINYGSVNGNKRLDVYYPLRRKTASASAGEKAGRKGAGSASADDGGASDDTQQQSHPLSPVVVFLPGGGWTFADKRYYLQLALTLRKRGLAVVIPDITLYPEGTIKEMVIDIRRVLAWTNRNIATYGGDRHNIHLMGHGSGAHLALLTVVQEAVVQSRDSYWLSSYSRQQSLSASQTTSQKHHSRDGSTVSADLPEERDFADDQEGEGTDGGSDFAQEKEGARQHRLRHATGTGEVEISAGIRRLEIWGEDEVARGDVSASSEDDDEEEEGSENRKKTTTTTARRTGMSASMKGMPKIKGMILLAGISDVIKHIRFEFKQSIEELSQTRNALGVTHANCLMASPSHLLFGAKQILDTSFLPSHFLLVHGGADRDVPIVQTVLLKTLLQGIGLQNVQLRAYRDLSHMECITALMQAGGAGVGGNGKAGAAPNGRSKYSNMILAEIVSMIHEAEATK